MKLIIEFDELDSLAEQEATPDETPGKPSAGTMQLDRGGIGVSGAGVRRPMRPPSSAMAQRWQTTANRRAGADHAAFGSRSDCIVPTKGVSRRPRAKVFSEMSDDLPIPNLSASPARQASWLNCGRGRAK